MDVPSSLVSWARFVEMRERRQQLAATAPPQPDGNADLIHNRGRVLLFDGMIRVEGDPSTSIVDTPRPHGSAGR
jgi:hypothetical protein